MQHTTWQCVQIAVKWVTGEKGLEVKEGKCVDACHGFPKDTSQAKFPRFIQTALILVYLT